MPNSIPIGDLHFVLFIIPGFMAVWSYRYFSGQEHKDGFSLLGFSFFWGLVLLPLYNLIIESNMNKFLSNPYSASVSLSIFGFFMGNLGLRISRTKFFKKRLERLKLKSDK